MAQSSSVYKISDQDRVRRFLIVGIRNGTFYAPAKQLLVENMQDLIALCATREGSQLILDQLLDVAITGAAAKHDTIDAALAILDIFGHNAVRKEALTHLRTICSIPTHLFTYLGYCHTLAKLFTRSKRWDKARKEAVASWYNDANFQHLVYQTSKYKQRNGWSHKDVVRLAHPIPPSQDHTLLYKFWTKGQLEYSASDVQNTKDFEYLEKIELLHMTEDASEAVKLITDNKFMREHIPTGLLTDPNIWNALLPHMPLNALVRNLGNLSKHGLIQGKNEKFIVDQLTNAEAVKHSKLHPFNVLIASKQYSQGLGNKGSGSWRVNPNVVNALSETYHLAFQNVQPTGKNIVVGVDVSGSMSWTGITGTESLKCVDAAAALGMAFVRSEENVSINAFSKKFIPLNITKETTLNEALKICQSENFGGTDACIPILQCIENKNYDVDAFIVITDNETYGSNVANLLREYRELSGKNAKLIVIGLAASRFSIADPEDGGMLDIAGFDSGAIRLVSDFLRE